MNKNEKLNGFINAVINGNDEAARAAFKPYVIEKSVELLKPQKTISEQLLEFVGNDSPIKLNGDHVLVNGKTVGYIDNDLNDINAGIRFIGENPQHKGEFDSIEELYDYIAKTFGVH